MIFYHYLAKEYVKVQKSQVHIIRVYKHDTDKEDGTVHSTTTY